MNHGGAAFLETPPAPTGGPRESLQLGLDVAKASQNILRLLESSHGVENYSHHWDAYAPSFHSSALSWVQSEDGDDWVAYPTKDLPPSKALEWIPTLSWVEFSDDRTALAKLQAVDGSQRYISLLRMDDASPGSSSPMVANDGWIVVRELVCPREDEDSMDIADQATQMTSLIQTLQEYLEIEHGGGQDDRKRAESLFAPEASLLTVGIAPPNRPPSDWSAPAGKFLEIPLGTYLQGVESQAPHGVGSRKHDGIVKIDFSSGAAAATVKVGNGAETMVFVDHLLLGRSKSTGSWTILSKTFSPQPWND